MHLNSQVLIKLYKIRIKEHFTIWKHKKCCNLNFGLATKAKVCKGACQEGSLGVTFHAPGNVRKCEGMNPHTPK